MFENIKKDYNQNGFVIVKDVLDSSLAAEVEDHVHWLSEKYPGTRPEAFHHDMLVNDPFIHHLLNNKVLLEIIEKIIEKLSSNSLIVSTTGYTSRELYQLRYLLP